MAGIGQIGIGLWRGRRAFYALLAILGTSLLADYDPSIASRRAETYLDGPGEQVVNGTFATDTIWTKGTNWTITGGAAVATGVTAAQYLQQAVLTVGATYAITFTVTASANTCTPFAGTTAGVAVGAGTWTQIIIANGTALKFGGHASGFTGTIDNVSCIELPACDVANAPGLVGPALVAASHATALKFNPAGGPDGRGCLVGLGGQYATADALAAYFTGTDKPIYALAAFNGTTTTAQYLFSVGNSGTNTPYKSLPRLGSDTMRVEVRDDASSSKTATGVAGAWSGGAKMIAMSIPAGTAAYTWINEAPDLVAGDVDIGATTLNIFTIGGLGRVGVTYPIFGNLRRFAVGTTATGTTIQQASAQLRSEVGL